MAKKIEIFEPAMCCPTGLCGASVDPELLRISAIAETLKQHNILLKRYNLTNNPQEFVSNKVVNGLLVSDGEKALPVTLVDGKVTKQGAYPTTEELSDWTQFSIPLNKPKRTLGSCCKGSGCC